MGINVLHLPFHQVRVSDQGARPRRATVKVRVEVVERLTRSPHPPRFPARTYMRHVMEDDRVRHLVDLFQAQDPDRDDLFYSIVGKDRIYFELQKLTSSTCNFPQIIP